MLTIYCVQTFYSTKEKCFQKEYNARRYFNQLAKNIDPDLLEFYRLEVSQDDFINITIDD